MGHRIMKLANGPLYRNVQGLDFRVLMYLAQVVLDNDRDDIPSATYFGGIAPIVEHVYELAPDAPEYRARYSTIQKAMRRLDEMGAIRRTLHGVGGARSQYEICPLQGILPNPRQATLPTPTLSTSQGAKTDPSLAPPRVRSVHPQGCAVSTSQGALIAPPGVLTSKDSTKETTKEHMYEPPVPRTRDLARTSAPAHEPTTTTRGLR